MPRTRGKAGSSPRSVALSPTLACVGWTRTSSASCGELSGRAVPLSSGLPGRRGSRGPFPCCARPPVRIPEESALTVRSAPRSQAVSTPRPTHFSQWLVVFLT